MIWLLQILELQELLHRPLVGQKEAPGEREKGGEREVVEVVEVLITHLHNNDLRLVSAAEALTEVLEVLRLTTPPLLTSGLKFLRFYGAKWGAA